MSQHKSGRDNQIWEVSQDFVFSRRPLQWNGTDTLLEAWLCCQAKDKEGKWSQNKKIRFFPSFWPKQVLSWSVFEGDIKKILHVCDSTLDWNLTLEWIGSLWTDDLCDIFAKCEGKKKKKSHSQQNLSDLRYYRTFLMLYSLSGLTSVVHSSLSALRY